MNFALIGLAGIIGTTAMIGVMSLAHRLKWANADMIRAIGSLYTRSYELALLPGLVVHYTFGIFFSYIYAMLVGAAPVVTAGSAMIIASFVGLVHGLIVGLMLEVLVAEHHPLERFKKVGFPVVAAHVVGHVVYGFSLGAFFAVAWNQIHDTIENFAQGGIIGDLLGYSVVWLPLFGPPVFFIGYLVYSTLTAEVRIEARKLEHKHHRTGRGNKVRTVQKKRTASRSKMAA